MCIFSLLRYLFFISSVIDRSEVIAGDDLSDDSNSVIEMFAIPPLARQPVERQQERPSSTSTTNTSRSTTSTSNNTSQSASTTTANTSTANTSKGTTTNATQRRSALGGFVFTGNGRTGIRLANHAAEIIKLLLHEIILMRRFLHWFLVGRSTLVSYSTVGL